MSAAPALYRLATETIGAPTTDLNRQRPYVPKTSRCLVLRSPQPVAISSTTLLQRALAPGAGDSADPLARVSSVVLPTEWWLPDNATGTRLVGHKLSLASPHDTGCVVASDPLPSGGRIACVAEVDGGRRIAVCDAHGQVVTPVLPLPLDEQAWAGLMPDDASSGPSAKKRRTEDGPTQGRPWTLVADRHAASPQRGALCPLGVAGWAGLIANDHHHVLVAREAYKDLRVVDLNSGSVAATFYATHAPTSVSWTLSNTAWPLVTLADGPVLTTFDVRARGEACAHRLSLRPGAMAWSVTSVGASAPFTVAVSDSARCITLYDVRKWSVTHSLSSVLQHACVGLTPAGRQGTYVACTGLDSELRIVAPMSKAEAAAPLGADGAEAAVGPTASTFRTRIDTTVHCNAAWFGDWASVAGEEDASNGVPFGLMAGVSSTNEVFVAIQT